MSLEQLQTEYNRYKNIKTNAVFACNSISSLRGELTTTANVFAENVIIGGQPYDQGKLNEYSSNLGGVYDNFQSIISICNTKMNELQTQINVEKARARARSSSIPNSKSRDSGLPSVLRM